MLVYEDADVPALDLIESCLVGGNWTGPYYRDFNGINIIVINVFCLMFLILMFKLSTLTPSLTPATSCISSVNNCSTRSDISYTDLLWFLLTVNVNGSERDGEVAERDGGDY